MAAENKDDIIIAMLEDMKYGMKSQKCEQVDFTKFELLTKQLENNIKATSSYMERMEYVLDESHKPIISQRKITIDIVAKEAVFIFIAMALLISLMGSALYFASRPNYDRDDNDLKYRYIKMKGDTAPECIDELEDIFEINRNNTRIRQIKKDIERYEQAIKKRAAIEEQIQMKAIETEKLNKQLNSIKNKGK